MCKIFNFKNEPVDQHNILTYLIPSAIFEKNDYSFVIDAYVINYSVYNIDKTDSMAESLDNLNLVDLDYDFDVYNSKLLKYISITSKDAITSPLCCALTKSINTIINNVLNINGGVDSFLEDYEAIVNSANESDVSKKVLELLHIYIQQQLNIFKSGIYSNASLKEKMVCKLKNGISIQIPLYIQQEYITLIPSILINKILTNDYISPENELYETLQDKYFNHLSYNDYGYNKLIGYYINKENEYGRIDLYQTIKNGIKVIKKDIY